MNHGCENEGECIDGLGTFSCLCKPGFRYTQYSRTKNGLRTKGCVLMDQEHSHVYVNQASGIHNIQGLITD